MNKEICSDELYESRFSDELDYIKDMHEPIQDGDVCVSGVVDHLWECPKTVEIIEQSLPIPECGYEVVDFICVLRKIDDTIDTEDKENYDHKNGTVSIWSRRGGSKQ